MMGRQFNCRPNGGIVGQVANLSYTGGSMPKSRIERRLSKR